MDHPASGWQASRAVPPGLYSEVLIIRRHRYLRGGIGYRIILLASERGDIASVTVAGNQIDIVISSL